MQYGNYGMTGPSNLSQRGMSQAKNKGGIVKKAIRTAIKTYLGGGLGGLSEVGGGVMGEIGGAAMGGAEGLQGMMTEKLGMPVGAGGVQDFITEKTGMPIGGGAIVGKGLEAAGVNPTTVGHAQNLVEAGSDPQRKYGNVNQAMDPSEYMRPASVPTASSRQINRQGGVRNLVAQRFGEGSPITQYIGAFEHGTPHEGVVVPGNPAAGPDSQRISFDATPGEKVHVEPARPDLVGAHRRPTSKGGEWTPYADDFGSQSGDVVIPNEKKATGFQKTLGYLSLVAGKFQGKPLKEFDDIQNWNFAHSASEAIMNARLQRAYEGKAGRTDYPGYINEQAALDSMRARMGSPESGVMKTIGAERMQTVGNMDDGTGRLNVQQQVRGVDPEGRLAWSPVEGGYEGPGSAVPAGSDRKVFYDSGGNQTDGAIATQYRLSRYNRATGQYDEPEGPMVQIQAGIGAAGIYRLDAKDQDLYDTAKGMEAILADTGFGVSGGKGNTDALTIAAVQPMIDAILKGNVSARFDPKKKAEFAAIKKQLMIVVKDWVGSRHPQTENKKANTRVGEVVEPGALSPFPSWLGPDTDI